MDSYYLIPLLATASLYLMYRLAKKGYGELTSPLRFLPGPSGANFLLGHFRTLQVGETQYFTCAAEQSSPQNDSTINVKWREEFGANYQFRGLLNTGLLAVEMEEHRQQNPAFGVPQIRELTGILNQNSSLDETGEPNELNQALTRIFRSPEAQRQGMLRVIQASIPPFPGGKYISNARTTMTNIAKELLEDSKNAVRASGEEASSTPRDLLSLMVKSNMSKDIPQRLRLSDADVIAQIPTFFVAGHERPEFCSTATALALHALSIHPSVQSKLREELLSLGTDNPTMDELNSLPYLENVIRETMRLYPPVTFAIRIAMADDVIPLSRSYLDRNGRSHDSISVRKGTEIRIDIAAVHQDKDLWGDDTEDFRPSRWEKISEAASHIPSVWANLLSFLAGTYTDRTCIGFRFSLDEIPAFYPFEFEMAVPTSDIAFSATPVSRPTAKGREPAVTAGTAVFGGLMRHP
ncbi:cytochrome P450 [Mycena metata]|uniref:Cytochrome P450 n=1 Tax=Mycena metata TaxID=1033252 RepID=A0AAD7IQ39_9AGAR|nr:cytochrome P450 [Mycena metata]